MIVEDQLDRGVGRIGGVEKLEEIDEFAAPVAILDQGMDLAGDEIDAGQQADRAVALIFVLACEGRVHAGLGRQVRSGRFNGLDARFLVIGDDRHLVWLLLRRSRRLYVAELVGADTDSEAGDSLVDCPHGAVLRPAGDCTDGSGAGPTDTEYHSRKKALRT